jgi:hypothetical protein
MHPTRLRGASILEEPHSISDDAVRADGIPARADRIEQNQLVEV